MKIANIEFDASGLRASWLRFQVRFWRWCIKRMKIDPTSTGTGSMVADLASGRLPRLFLPRLLVAKARLAALKWWMDVVSARLERLFQQAIAYISKKPEGI